MRSFFKSIKDRILNPPEYLLDVSANLRAVIAQDYREILIIDVIIFAFLSASVHQIAFVFGRAEITPIALLKAIGIDGAIWILSRAISKRIFSVSTTRKTTKGKKVKLKGTAFTKFILWLGIILFIILTTTVNTLYELWDKTEVTGIIAFNISEDPMVLFTQTISSSFLAIIILFLTFVRAILAKNMTDSFTALKHSKRATGPAPDAGVAE